MYCNTTKLLGAATYLVQASVKLEQNYIVWWEDKSWTCTITAYEWIGLSFLQVIFMNYNSLGKVVRLIYTWEQRFGH